MNRFGWVLFIALISYFIFLIRQDIIDNVGLRQETARLARKIESEKSRAGQLQQKLASLKNQDYLERLARTRLGLIKKGETAYKVFGGDQVNGH